MRIEGDTGRREWKTRMEDESGKPEWKTRVENQNGRREWKTRMEEWKRGYFSFNKRKKHKTSPTNLIYQIAKYLTLPNIKVKRYIQQTEIQSQKIRKFLTK